MSFDEEIERINRKKIEEMMQRKMSPKAEGAPRSPAKPIELTDANFSSTVGKYPLMVVDFWAPWCGPCRMVSPIIEQLASEYSGKVAFGKVNVDENPMISGSFQIQGIPTIMIMKNGQPVDGIVGAAPKDFIESKIKAQMGGDARVYG